MKMIPYPIPKPMTAPIAPSPNPKAIHRPMVRIIADADGNILERYGYGDYGEPAFFDNQGTPQPALTASAFGNSLDMVDLPKITFFRIIQEIFHRLARPWKPPSYMQ